MDLEFLKHLTKNLEKNLEKISNALNEIESVCREVPIKNDNYSSCLETKIYVYFNSISSTNSEQFIIEHFRLNSNGWPTALLDNIFSSKGNELLLETQSQLNAICNELEIRKVYLSSAFDPNDLNPCFNSVLDNSSIKLSKAFSILHAAKKLLPTEN